MKGQTEKRKQRNPASPESCWEPFVGGSPFSATRGGGHLLRAPLGLAISSEGIGHASGKNGMPKVTPLCLKTVSCCWVETVNIQL